MKYTPIAFRKIEPGHEPPQPIRRMDGSPLILIQENGDIRWTYTREGKDELVRLYRPLHDVLLWVWKGQSTSGVGLGWSSDEVFELGKTDLERHYR